MSFRIEIYEIESPAGTEVKGRDVKRYATIAKAIDAWYTKQEEKAA